MSELGLGSIRWYEPNDNINCDHIKWLPLYLQIDTKSKLWASVKNCKKYGMDKVKDLFSLNSEILSFKTFNTKYTWALIFFKKQMQLLYSQNIFIWNQNTKLETF
jgi:hypothetical protein